MNFKQINVRICIKINEMYFSVFYKIKNIRKGNFNSVHTRCKDKVDLQGVFVKIGDFTKFKGFLGIPREQTIVRKSNPQKIARKMDFSEPRLLQFTWFGHC